MQVVIWVILTDSVCTHAHRWGAHHSSTRWDPPDPQDSSAPVAPDDSAQQAPGSSQPELCIAHTHTDDLKGMLPPPPLLLLPKLLLIHTKFNTVVRYVIDDDLEKLLATDTEHKHTNHPSCWQLVHYCGVILGVHTTSATVTVLSCSGSLYSKRKMGVWGYVRSVELLRALGAGLLIDIPQFPTEQRQQALQASQRHSRSPDLQTCSLYTTV